MIVEEVANHTINYLKKRGVSSARRMAEEMLCHVLSLKRMDLYLDFQRPLNPKELSRCREILKRLGEGEPIQYILGEVFFYEGVFEATPSVLIPRPETELLVDKIVRKLQKGSIIDKKLWDVCCGSGCIGIALKKALPDLTVSLSDISIDALAVAKRNAQRNEVDVSLLQGDMFAPFEGKADIIVSNPPYITQGEYSQLDRSVKDFEPALALLGGEDGLDFYRILARDLKKYLNPKGQLWLEVGAGQGDRVKELFENEGFCKMAVEKDWSGHDRFFSLENE